jgi:hypothetical protein
VIHYELAPDIREVRRYPLNAEMLNGKGHVRIARIEAIRFSRLQPQRAQRNEYPL